jgi:hypothetical protein
MAAAGVGQDFAARSRAKEHRFGRRKPRARRLPPTAFNNLRPAPGRRAEFQSALCPPTSHRLGVRVIVRRLVPIMEFRRFVPSATAKVIIGKPGLRRASSGGRTCGSSPALRRAVSNPNREFRERLREPKPRAGCFSSCRAARPLHVRRSRVGRVRVRRQVGRQTSEWFHRDRIAISKDN